MSNIQYPMDELERMDDTTENCKYSYLYDRLLCPEGHLLYEILRLRLIRRAQQDPNAPSFKEIMANLDEDGQPIARELFKK